jgi:phage-related protein
MQVQVLEFHYESTSIEDMESRINTYLDHHDVVDVQFSRWEDTMVAFFITED